jgi:hypothetical protein
VACAAACESFVARGVGSLFNSGALFLEALKKGLREYNLNEVLSSYWK